jgi:two-component system nitrogen regulation response regulator NtrX
MKILIVDDEKDVIISLREALEEYQVFGAHNISKAKLILKEEQNIDIAIIDIMLGEDDGIELLKFIRASYSTTECIMISGYSTIEKAVDSIKLGAFEFVEKPVSYQKIKVAIKNALEHHKLSRIIQSEIEKYELAGVSKSIEKINGLIEKANKVNFPVLVTGPSGCGKEHIANLIHLKSKRVSGELVKLNCSAIPENLFESELFGYEKGAFTGANISKRGKIELASGGTLFLDEVGEMPLSQQAKLLRIFEDKELSRLGSEKKIKVDFRLICATNIDLKQAVKEKTFREDLYFRIGVIIIDIPPLSYRREDIPILAERFLKNLIAEDGKEKTFSQDALDTISSLPLKGNVRELKNIIYRLYLFTERDIIKKSDIEKICERKTIHTTETIFSKTMPYNEAKRELEKKYIETQLALHNWNVSKTAIALGMLPNNLIRKMKSLSVNDK